VRDWDYSWQQAYQPRVQQVLSRFSGEEREQVQQLSESYGRQYSLEGRRRMELRRIRQARQQWKEQVDSAVMQGDAEAACRWLEQGREVFVPEPDMPRQLQEVRNRSLHAAWQQQLQQDPYAALTAWQADDARRPEGEEALRALEADMAQTRQNLHRELAVQLAAAVEQGQEPDATMLARAAAAGVLSPELVAAQGRAVELLSVEDTCNWLRRIDEREPGEDEPLVVEIALAALPAEQRRLLLQRVQHTSALPPQQRCSMSRTLWNR
jgi:hypothetical protein